LNIFILYLTCRRCTETSPSLYTDYVKEQCNLLSREAEEMTRRNIEKKMLLSKVFWKISFLSLNTEKLGKNRGIF
jgi:hypothetical protein